VIKPTLGSTYTSVRSLHTRAQFHLPSARCYLRMKSAKQQNRPREPAVAGQGRRRSARRPSLDRAARCRSSNQCPLHSWLQRVHHEKHRRSPNAGLAKEPARVRYSGCCYGRKPGSIQHGRSCPHPAGLRSRPVRQELGATASVKWME
jgi:hypothetical protein